MVDSELEKLHRVDFETMKTVLDVFHKNDLPYFLIAGTLLGAVRHKGFIPWDDDIDIGVPRKSYESFLENYADELPPRYRVENFKNTPSAKYYITRILDTKTQVEELRDESTTFAAIDLFPIDGTPNNKIVRKFFILHVMYLRMLTSISQSNNIDMQRKRNLLERMFVFIVKRLPQSKIINRRNIFWKLDKLLAKYPLNESEYVGSLMGAYREKELFKGDFIRKLSKVKFEGDSFYAPYNWNGYLKSMYGDYMKIPSTESIQAKRHFRIVKRSPK